MRALLDKVQGRRWRVHNGLFAKDVRPKLQRKVYIDPNMVRRLVNSICLTGSRHLNGFNLEVMSIFLKEIDDEETWIFESTENCQYLFFSCTSINFISLIIWSKFAISVNVSLIVSYVPVVSRRHCSSTSVLTCIINQSAFPMGASS